MAEPVEWLPDGTPRSPRFGDIYRSSGGGLEQARQVFLHGCELPRAWAGQAQWRILETGFGLGLNFLAAWRAWKDDPQRPRMLHFASVEAWPVDAQDVLRSAQGHAELIPLATQLAQQWFGLMPGVHRLVFEDGHVLLTLHVGEVRDALRDASFAPDSIFLDGFDPRQNPQMWDAHALKAVARHARHGTTLASWTASGEVRRLLSQYGFQVTKAQGLAPKRHCTRAVFAPPWPLRRAPARGSVVPARCVVVGAGLAGAAVAASLARRGWQVTVLDAAAAPASGASGLPAGLLAPHVSPDDNLLSRLSRCGVRATLQQAAMLLREGVDWQMNGVLEHRPAAPPTPAGLPEMAPWTRPASRDQLDAARLGPGTHGQWHEKAGWIRPATLVRAWLSQPGIAFRGPATVGGFERSAEGWQVLGEKAQPLAQAQLIVVAAAHASAALLGTDLRLQPVRGQVSWADASGATLPPFAVNGNGHFIPLPRDGGTAWVCGSSFERGSADSSLRPDDHAVNLQRLRALLPQVAEALAPQFAHSQVHAWAGVRCASADRRPLVGELAPGLWVSTAMGSRGLTFSALCAELLAARLHGEPLPLPARLARALDVARLRKDIGPPPG